MDELLTLLKKAIPSVDFENEKALVDDGLLASLDVIVIIAEINDVFGIMIPSDEIIPDNFNSVEAMYELIEDLRS